MHAKPHDTIISSEFQGVEHGIHGQAPQYLVDLPTSLRRRFSAASQVRQSTTPGPSASPVSAGYKRTADGLSLLLARRPGTHCLTI